MVYDAGPEPIAIRVASGRVNIVAFSMDSDSEPINLNRSELFTALYKLLGIKSKVTHPYAPQGNMVESWHRWLGSALRILYYERDMDVDQSLPFILWISLEIFHARHRCLATR